MKCDNCQGKNDVTTFTASGKEMTLCIGCRSDKFGRKISTRGWKRED